MLTFWYTLLILAGILAAAGLLALMTQWPRG